MDWTAKVDPKLPFGRCLYKQWLAELALDLLVRHPERLTPLKPQSAEMRTLVCLVEQRRSLVNDKIRITNRLRSALKQYYPQMLEWF
jgi:hypothetical protein